ncbi:hypothetical protein EDB81DRAFT_866283 [Dactylonectria macrodidyma]|uniref:F-box domain-containing protein n=1 Tax=Dactylonectria macrodidyma TaxID=307937 RepID=A0A9P9FPY9_9HYPO|nr:hypothetical protein EDB81DRAFT_866283 [Dactylonectria macrodidyma]
MSYSGGLAELPLHILYIICSFSPKASIIQLRLTSLALKTAATPWAFRHVQLEFFGKDFKRFVSIAKSPSLRPWVQEISCDTWMVTHPRRGTDSWHNCAEGFLHALSYLRYFRRVRALHLRFDAHSGSSTRNTWSSIIEETWDFRFHVLDTVFQCLAGTWSRDILERAGYGSTYDFEDVDTKPDNDWDTLKAQPICLKMLTIANLAAYDDQRLANSEAFRKVLSSPTLTDLKLYISPENDITKPGVSFRYPEPYEFFAALPDTWLAPSLAQNLRVLSLYSRNPWGWCPKMDFRTVNPGKGVNSGFPLLKVLALGNYTFSHEWQIEWIASLGQQNEAGGLEELYLDDCPILYTACQVAPIDNGETILGHDEDGKELSISNHGYPIKEVITQPHVYGDPQLQTQQYPLRWYMVLQHWKDAMKGLRVFRMGHGEWQRVSVDTFRACAGQFSKPLRDKDKFVLTHLLTDKEFRSFGCPGPTEPAGPAPADDFVDLVDWNADEVLAVEGDPKYQHGTGLRQERIDLMRYFQHSCGTWTESQRDENSFFDDREVWAPEEETIAKDTAAYNMLVSAVQLRHGPEDKLV